MDVKKAKAELGLRRVAAPPPPNLPPAQISKRARALLAGDPSNLVVTLQNNTLAQLIPPNNALKGTNIFFGTYADVPGMAAVQGYKDAAGLAYLDQLVEKVLIRGAVGSEDPLVRRIGETVANDNTPWLIAALPIGATLRKSGRDKFGLTRSFQIESRIRHIESMQEHSIDVAIDIPEGTAMPDHAATYLSGSLWESQNVFMPTRVVLHESSHRAHASIVMNWMDRNRGVEEGQRAPAFSRHCAPSEGGVWLMDQGFFHLFLELAACAVAEDYFSSLNPGQHQADLEKTMAGTLAMTWDYLTDTSYSPYLRQNSIPAPTHDDGSIRKTRRQFLSLVT